MPSTSQPNFLFITTDQQRWDALGIHNPRIRTPAMDSLARDGMRFDRAYPTNAICAPGARQHDHRPQPARAPRLQQRQSQRGHPGRRRFAPPGRLRHGAGRQSPTSRAANTRTCCRIAPRPARRLIPDDGLWYGPYFGFDYVEILGAHTYPKGHWRVWLERHHPEGLELWKPVNALEPRTGAFHSWKNAVPAEWHYTHRTADRTVDWLRDHGRERPFFLWMSFYDPHQPFTPPRPYCDMYDPADMPPAVPREDVSNKPPQYQYARDGLPYQGYDTTSGWDGDHHGEIVAHYYGMTTFIDDGIARVLAELERLGLAENTHVIFSSDHGEGLNDHGIAAKPMMSYECVNRVPLLWRHPLTVEAGRVHAGRDDAARFRAHLARPCGRRSAGRPGGPQLRPAAARRDRDASRRGDRRAHRHLRQRSAGTRRSAGKAHPAPITQRVKMLVTEDWKLLHYGTTEYGELYNVKDDPEDLHNLWDDPAHAAVRAELVERLLIELINEEGGDPHLVTDNQPVAGSLRDARLMEPQPEVKADLEQRLRDLLA